MWKKLTKKHLKMKNTIKQWKTYLEICLASERMDFRKNGDKKEWNDKTIRNILNETGIFFAFFFFCDSLQQCEVFLHLCFVLIVINEKSLWKREKQFAAALKFVGINYSLICSECQRLALFQ